MEHILLKFWYSSILTTIIWLAIPIKLAHPEMVSASAAEFSCPDNVTELASLMLKDLPDYSNRVIQRGQTLNRKEGIRRYIITAAMAEFEPLGLPRIQYNSGDREQPEQLFFTVAERQYHNKKITTNRTYHWLFLTQTKAGWQEVMMFSRFGNSQSEHLSTPPKESTNGIIGQGVQLWLRDCRAGTVRLSSK